MFEGGLAELHTHLGGSVASEIMWSLAHEQGISLPVKDYWEFDRLVTVSDPRGVDGLDALNAIYHWTELIQSSPLAVEQSVHSAIGGAYRSQGITTLELRFNPMKRNRGGERDLDHIILAAIRGLDRASLGIARDRRRRARGRAQPDGRKPPVRDREPHPAQAASGLLDVVVGL
jgi:adenosine deaminase